MSDIENFIKDNSSILNEDDNALFERLGMTVGAEALASDGQELEIDLRGLGRRLFSRVSGSLRNILCGDAPSDIEDRERIVSALRLGPENRDLTIATAAAAIVAALGVSGGVAVIVATIVVRRVLTSGFDFATEDLRENVCAIWPGGTEAVIAPSTVMPIASVSKPAETHSGLESVGGLEMAKLAVKTMRFEGAHGSASEELSRSARTFVRTGKSVRPIAANPARGLESVIGHDERVRIVDTDLSPWRKICALQLVSPTGGTAVGTGFFVGPRTIVTAGHCVHHMPFFGGWVDHVLVSPGRNGDEFPFGTVRANRVSALSNWVSNADPDFDIGCIHLDEDKGLETGTFDFAALDDAQLQSHLVNVSGYPADLADGREQYFAANRILHVSDRRIFYDVDTFGGQSGSGVFIQQDSASEPTVVAIHAYGTGGTPFHLGIEANSAPRILPEVFDVIRSWIEADTPASEKGTS